MRDTGGQQFAPRTRGPATYLKISICCSTPANQHEWPKKKKNFTYVHTEHVSERPNGVRAYIVRRLQSFIDSIVVGGETINVYIWYPITIPRFAVSIRRRWVADLIHRSGSIVAPANRMKNGIGNEGKRFPLPLPWNGGTGKIALKRIYTLKNFKSIGRLGLFTQNEYGTHCANNSIEK